MKRTSLILIELPPDIWSALPKDRPFKELAGDAQSSERRIKKNVNPGRERARYTQLCDWIELSALKLVREETIKHSVTWADGNDEDRVGRYLRLIECLQTNPALLTTLQKPVGIWDRIVSFFRRKVNVATDGVRENPLGKSFYPPGPAVLEQQVVFGRITPARLQAVAPELAHEDLKAYGQLAREKAEFCSGAAKRGSAVVEVLAALPE